MFWKNEPDGRDATATALPVVRRWSPAARLTTWYAGSAFVIVLAATGFFYWSSVRNLDRQDDRLLGDRARVLQSVLVNQGGNIPALRHEVEEEWEAHQRTEIHVRILDEAGRVVVETLGISRLLPPASFPIPTLEPGLGADAPATSGVLFRVLAVRGTTGTPTLSSYTIHVGTAAWKSNSRPITGKPISVLGGL